MFKKNYIIAYLLDFYRLTIQKNSQIFITAVLVAASLSLFCCYHLAPAEQTAKTAPQTLHAGMAQAKITPPLGTTMMGYGSRDMTHGCKSVHDDIYVRALMLR